MSAVCREDNKRQNQVQKRPNDGYAHRISCESVDLARAQARQVQVIHWEALQCKILCPNHPSPAAENPDATAWSDAR